jgi:hypothetical protein
VKLDPKKQIQTLIAVRERDERTRRDMEKTLAEQAARNCPCQTPISGR